MSYPVLLGELARQVYPIYTSCKTLLIDGNNRLQATARTGNATELVGQALAAGWRHIDTSLNYRNQNGTGEAIKASGIPRKDVGLACHNGPKMTY